MQPHDVQTLSDRFVQIFGRGESAPGVEDRPRSVHFVRAPGRVNLIGEHTDYNDGFVFPMAIEPEVRLVCRARTDGLIRLASTVYARELLEFSLQSKIERGSPAWGNYSRGVAAQLIG